MIPRFYVSAAQENWIIQLPLAESSKQPTISNERHMTQLKLEVGQASPSAVSNSGAHYSIFVSCNKCAGEHETGISITIENGPVGKHSLGGFYSGKPLPKSLATLSNQSFPCPLTGRQFIQKDTKQIFLVPIKGRPTSENDPRRNRKSAGMS